MNETRLRERLDELAGGIGLPDHPSLERRTIGRARRRRLANAATSLALIVGLLGGGYVGVRSIIRSSQPTIAIPAPDLDPTDPRLPPFQALESIWPDIDAHSLLVAQRLADDGHQPWRLDPGQTAVAFATNLLGWTYEDVMPGQTESGPGRAVVEIDNRTFDDSVPPVEVALRQLGRTGPDGVWSVVGVSTPMLELEEVGQSTDDAHAFVTVTLTPSADGTSSAAYELLVGGSYESVAHATTTRAEVDASTIEMDVSIPPTPEGRAILLVTVPGDAEAAHGAVAILIRTPVGEPEPAVDVTGVPPDVAATAQRIHDGALARDLDALAQLLDPMTFTYNFSDGGDPIPEWRQDPSVLDLAVAVLELPPIEREIEGMGTFYIWPYLIDSDFSALSDGERADLAALGFTDRDIELIVQGGTGYQGPRVIIDETGLWRGFVTVGE